MLFTKSQHWSTMKSERWRGFQATNTARCVVNMQLPAVPCSEQGCSSQICPGTTVAWLAGPSRILWGQKGPVGVTCCLQEVLQIRNYLCSCGEQSWHFLGDAKYVSKTRVSTAMQGMLWCYSSKWSYKIYWIGKASLHKVEETIRSVK